MRKTKRPRKGAPRPENHLPGPAPGRLSMIQDFVNTRDDDTERDELATPEALTRWLAHRKLLPSVTPLDRAVWQSALDVRDGLRALLRTHRGLPLDEKALDRLNRAIRDAHPVVSLDRGGRISLETAKAGWTGVLVQLLDVVVEGILDGRWRRLRTCSNPKCQWVFYDASRNLGGKWCNKRRCGSRVYSKRYRRRGPSYTRNGWLPPQSAAIDS